ncbi:MAG: hypothetical protein JSW50_11230 [Candidatus Latescibacterota bacterium]|nr:MAG: hypothetical protein JSW50_11230 [Candidatus Latescibacterota bacterium]
MRTVIATICAVLLLLAGCSDESDCPTCPGDGKIEVPDPSLQNIWPNADKTSWTYRQNHRVWEGNITIYPTRDDIPNVPLPTWSEIFSLVEARTPVEPNTATRRIYRMQFDGVTTTTSGVTAQRLTDEVYIETAQGLKRGAEKLGMPILTRLFTIRPDIWNRIRQSKDPILGLGLTSDPSGGATVLAHGENIWHGLLSNPARILYMPYLLRGGAWEKTAEWIGLYDDLSARLAWKFLAEDITVGSEFSYQLIPDFSDDTFLHGRVYRQTSVETEIGTFEKALDCLYILDFGISTVTDLQGEVVGYMRSFDYGRVIYAPTIGPVYSYERWGVEPGDPPTPGFEDFTTMLIGTGTPAN